MSFGAQVGPQSFRGGSEGPGRFHRCPGRAFEKHYFLFLGGGGNLSLVQWNIDVFSLGLFCEGVSGHLIMVRFCMVFKV